MKKKAEHFRPAEVILCTLALVAALLLCVCMGSVNIPLPDTLDALRAGLGGGTGSSTSHSVILQVRLPRVLCVALVGAALSVCGTAMQGLLRNPLADSSTLGVSSGASLGAVVAISLGLNFAALPLAGTTATAILFAFLSLLAILSLAYRLDYSLSTNTIILIGVIFSMFTNAIMSFFITFAGESKLKTITFWTMGSLAGASYLNALMLFVALLAGAGVLLSHAGELNAFAVGEDNARHVGVNVRRVKTTVLITVAVLTGVCVAIGGAIGFVGLVMPHMTRMVVGPNHRRLLPATLFSGAVFLLLADLFGRVVLRPLELPIGVVTSFVGSIAFVYIFYTQRKRVG